MTFEQILARRRSVRVFDPSRPVAVGEILAAVQAAQDAPSWKNSETARFHIVNNADLVSALRDCLPQRNQDSTAGCSAYIVTTFVRDISGFNTDTGQPVNELGNAWGAYDLGLFTSVFLLKATELGFDTLILGLRDARALRALLAISDREEIAAVIACGHRTFDPTRPDRLPLATVATVH